MRFLVVSFAPLLKKGEQYYSYAPYVREMEIWFKYVSEIGFCCPSDYSGQNLLISAFSLKEFKFFPIPELSSKDIFKPWRILKAVLIIIKAMRWADHIHLRCPGNIGLLGCIVQIFFPFKKKTAKYAGNWDPNMRKVKSYNLQRFILANSFLSKNMLVLVYGEWPNQTKNIIPFFTASYSTEEIIETPVRKLEGRIKCIYCGFLLKEKRPLKSIQVVEKLYKIGYDIELEILGDGPEFETLNDYIRNKNINNVIKLRGNIPPNELKLYMQKAHFLTFFGHDSEGWPKVVAEAMFWGCVPLVRSVSCTKFMLGDGLRGTIVEDSVDSMVNAIIRYIENPGLYHITALKAMEWSRQYTLEKFEEGIKQLLLK